MKGQPISKVSTDGGESLAHNPFAALNTAGLPDKPATGADAGGRPPSFGPNAPQSDGNGGNARAGQEKMGGARAGVGKPGEERRNRGRVDIVRETGGRGGKTVTVVSGFIGIGLPEKEALAKKMRAACGCGGTVKEGQIEIQGDQRETVARILSEAGFRPVFAGG